MAKRKKPVESQQFPSPGDGVHPMLVMIRYALRIGPQSNLKAELEPLQSLLTELDAALAAGDAGKSAMLGVGLGCAWERLMCRSAHREIVKEGYRATAAKAKRKKSRKKKASDRAARARALFNQIPEERRHGHLTRIYKDIGRQVGLSASRTRHLLRG
jgi:hypothetical protein